MVVIYCCLDKENYKIIKFPMNNFCYFEIRDSLFNPPSNKHPPLKASKLNFEIDSKNYIFTINFEDSLIQLGRPKLM